jgi:hypothetical protein
MARYKLVRLAAYTVVTMLLVGCYGRGNHASDLQDNTMSTEKLAKYAKAKPIDWKLGPLSDSDADRNIVFRTPPRATAQRGDGARKPVAPRPMIQGGAGCLCLGEDGSRYVAGTFSGRKDFDIGPGLDIHEALGKEDAFVTRFDRNGKYCWTKTFGAKELMYLGGLALSDGALYVLCSEDTGHAAILAMDAATGAPKSGFGDSGCQMFRCGNADIAIGIRCRRGAVYAAIKCMEIPGGALPDFWFAAVLAVDPKDGSAIAKFGTGGVQTVGNAIPSTSPLVAEAWGNGIGSLSPAALALSGPTLYVLGRCERDTLGIGRQGAISAGFRGLAMIAAIDAQTGTAAARFGSNGIVLMPERVFSVTDVAAFADSLYATGQWRQYPDEGAFIGVMDAGTGALSTKFGNRGLMLFTVGESCYGGRGIRVNEQLAYVAGDYSREKTNGLFIAAFRRVDGAPVKSFGDDGVVSIEGGFGVGAAMEPFGDSLFMAAGTSDVLEHEGPQIKIGDTVIRHGDMNGYLFQFSKDGKLISK